MKPWLKGGIIGGAVGLVYSLSFLLCGLLTDPYICMLFNMPDILLRWGEILNATGPTHYLIKVLLNIAIGFIIGSVIGLFSPSIKSITSKMKFLRKPWLAGGIIGGIVGLVYSLSFFLCGFIIYSFSCILFHIPIMLLHGRGILDASAPTSYLIGVLLNIAIGFLIGALIGLFCSLVILIIRKIESLK